MGVRLEEVAVEGLADAEQQLGVDGRLVVYALQGARSDTDSVGKPLVGVALAAEFIADKVAYVYLHIATCLVRRRPACKGSGFAGGTPAYHNVGYRFLEHLPTTTDKKGRRAISSPNCGRGIPLQGKTQILACQRASAFVALVALYESSTFQLGRNK